MKLFVGIIFLMLLTALVYLLKKKNIKFFKHNIINRWHIDNKNFLYVVEWEKKQYLLLIGQNASIVVDSRNISDIAKDKS